MTETTARPNVLVFFTDQQRADTCGCYGQRLPVTPNLDRMAAEGTLFRNAFSMQPVCGPARSALQTGLYPTETGCFRNNIALPSGCRTVADAFHDAGYETAYLGKWHLASGGNPHDPDRPPRNLRTEPVPPEYRGGYRDFWLASDVLEFTSHGYDGHMFDDDGNRRTFPEGRYRVDAQTDWLLEYLDNRDRTRPFFMFASYIEPHHQNDRDVFEGPHGSPERWRDYDVPGDLEGCDGDWQRNYPDYLGCVNSLDNALGRVRTKLETLGIADNTLLIFTSDHGCHFRTRNGEYKRSCHEASLRVPMVITGPGFVGGTAVDALVSLMDIPKTILGAARITPWPQVRGDDLGPLARGEAGDWKSEVFYQISESQVGRGIRTARWKYAVAAPGIRGVDAPGAAIYREAFLYDLDADPHERNNLVADPKWADLRVRLAERLRARMAAAGEDRPDILPAQ